MFYASSISEVGVDQISERAGVTKKTLYYHFPSKEVLVAHCYAKRADMVLAKYQSWASGAATARGKIAAIFSALRDYSSEPGFHGCGFLRAAAELASRRDHPVAEVVAGYKRGFEAWLSSLFAAEHCAAPERLAKQVLMMIDGCLAHIMFHRDPSYADTAAAAADTLVATGCCNTPA